jgi:serine/threonine-protein kinase ULK/ATG1
MSPQVLSRNYYTYKCDVWSLGVIFYELLMGELPWKTNDSSQLLFKIMENPCPYENRKRQLSETSRAILDGTLKYLEK